jgi:integrase/ribosomal protein L40E
MTDTHGCAGRLEAARRRLSRLEHGELLLKFLDHLQALGLSPSRVLKYATQLCTLFKNVPFDPVSANRADVERAVAWINSQPYKSWTKHGLKLTVKKLLQYAKCGSCHRKAPVPPEASWIEVKADDKDSRVTPESLLTAEDVKAMIRQAENERDKALIAVLFEAALRPGELLTMRVGSVEFKDEYCLITVNGKTGLKRIPLVASHKPLLEWLQKHPRKEDLNAPLWAALSNNSKGKCVSYSYLRKLLKRLAKKANLGKDVWPYLLRHSSLTSLAKVFTESKLELYAGWVQGSKMARRYVHFSARDLEEAVLEIHGLKQTSRTSGVLKAEECPRCGAKNPPDALRCNCCGYIIDKELATKKEEEERRKDEEILARVAKLEQLVRSLLYGSPAPKSPLNVQVPQAT